MTQKGQYHVEKRSKSTYILVLAEKKVEFWSYPPSPLFLIPFIVLAVFKPFLTFFWILAGKKVEFWSYPPLAPFWRFWSLPRFWLFLTLLTFFWILAGKKVEFWSTPCLFYHFCSGPFLLF